MAKRVRALQAEDHSKKSSVQSYQICKAERAERRLSLEPLHMDQRAGRPGLGAHQVWWRHDDTKWGAMYTFTGLEKGQGNARV